MLIPKNIVICDLDGTIALDEKRARHLHPIETRNWQAYFAECDTDVPNIPVIELLRILSTELEIYIMSGRCMSVHKKTCRWLDQYDVPYNFLKMRTEGDRTDDHVLKLGWAKELMIEQQIKFVIEDRQRVVDAWRLAGHTVLQVAPGNF